jgi:hypothetical protein
MQVGNVAIPSGRWDDVHIVVFAAMSPERP